MMGGLQIPSYLLCMVSDVNVSMKRMQSTRKPNPSTCYSLSSPITTKPMLKLYGSRDQNIIDAHSFVHELRAIAKPDLAKI